MFGPENKIMLFHVQEDEGGEKTDECNGKAKVIIRWPKLIIAYLHCGVTKFPLLFQFHEEKKSQLEIFTAYSAKKKKIEKEEKYIFSKIR